MTGGLKEAHRAAIVDVIASNHRVERSVLFGSRVMSTHSAASDVDVALIGDRLTLTDQARLAAAIEELPFARHVDLLLHKSVDNPSLLEHIRAHGLEWYRRETNSESIQRSDDGWRDAEFGDVVDLAFVEANGEPSASGSSVRILHLESACGSGSIRASQDFRKATTTKRVIKTGPLAAGDMVITMESGSRNGIGAPHWCERICDAWPAAENWRS